MFSFRTFMGLFSRWAASVPVLPRAVEGINFSVFIVLARAPFY